MEMAGRESKVGSAILIASSSLSLSFSLEKSKRSSTMKCSGTETPGAEEELLLSVGNCVQKLLWKNSGASMAG